MDSGFVQIALCSQWPVVFHLSSLVCPLKTPRFEEIPTSLTLSNGTDKMYQCKWTNLFCELFFLSVCVSGVPPLPICWRAVCVSTPSAWLPSPPLVRVCRDGIKASHCFISVYNFVFFFVSWFGFLYSGNVSFAYRYIEWAHRCCMSFRADSSVD